MRLNHREHEVHGAFSFAGVFKGMAEGMFRHPAQHRRQTKSGPSLETVVWFWLMLFSFGFWGWLTAEFDVHLAFAFSPVLGIIFAIPPLFCAIVVLFAAAPIVFSWIITIIAGVRVFARIVRGKQ